MHEISEFTAYNAKDEKKRLTWRRSRMHWWGLIDRMLYPLCFVFLYIFPCSFILSLVKIPVLFVPVLLACLGFYPQLSLPVRLFFCSASPRFLMVSPSPVRSSYGFPLVPVLYVKSPPSGSVFFFFFSPSVFALCSPFSLAFLWLL